MSASQEKCDASADNASNKDPNTNLEKTTKSEVDKKSCKSETENRNKTDREIKQNKNKLQSRKIVEAEVFKSVEKSVLKDLRAMKKSESKKAADSKSVNVLDIMSNMKSLKKESDSWKNSPWSDPRAREAAAKAKAEKIKEEKIQREIQKLLDMKVRNKDYEKFPAFTTWTEPKQGSSPVDIYKCWICNITIETGRIDLMGHVSSMKHNKNKSQFIELKTKVDVNPLGKKPLESDSLQERAVPSIQSDVANNNQTELCDSKKLNAEENKNSNEKKMFTPFGEFSGSIEKIKREKLEKERKEWEQKRLLDRQVASSSNIDEKSNDKTDENTPMAHGPHKRIRGGGSIEESNFEPGFNSPKKPRLDKIEDNVPTENPEAKTEITDNHANGNDLQEIVDENIDEVADDWQGDSVSNSPIINFDDVNIAPNDVESQEMDHDDWPDDENDQDDIQPQVSTANLNANNSIVDEYDDWPEDESMEGGSRTNWDKDMKHIPMNVKHAETYPISPFIGFDNTPPSTPHAALSPGEITPSASAESDDASSVADDIEDAKQQLLELDEIGEAAKIEGGVNPLFLNSLANCQDESCMAQNEIDDEESIPDDILQDCQQNKEDDDYPLTSPDIQDFNNSMGKNSMVGWNQGSSQSEDSDSNIGGVPEDALEYLDIMEKQKEKETSPACKATTPFLLQQEIPLPVPPPTTKCVTKRSELTAADLDKLPKPMTLQDRVMMKFIKKRTSTVESLVTAAPEFAKQSDYSQILDESSANLSNPKNKILPCSEETSSSTLCKFINSEKSTSEGNCNKSLLNTTNLKQRTNQEEKDAKDTKLELEASTPNCEKDSQALNKLPTSSNDPAATENDLLPTGSNNLDSTVKELVSELCNNQTEEEKARKIKEKLQEFMKLQSQDEKKPTGPSFQTAHQFSRAINNDEHQYRGGQPPYIPVLYPPNCSLQYHHEFIPPFPPNNITVNITPSSGQAEPYSGLFFPGRSPYNAAAFNPPLPTEDYYSSNDSYNSRVRSHLESGIHKLRNIRERPLQRNHRRNRARFEQSSLLKNEDTNGRFDSYPSRDQPHDSEFMQHQDYDHRMNPQFQSNNGRYQQRRQERQHAMPSEYREKHQISPITQSATHRRNRWDQGPKPLSLNSSHIDNAGHGNSQLMPPSPPYRHQSGKRTHDDKEMNYPKTQICQSRLALSSEENEAKLLRNPINSNYHKKLSYNEEENILSRELEQLNEWDQKLEANLRSNLK